MRPSPASRVSATNGPSRSASRSGPSAARSRLSNVSTRQTTPAAAALPELRAERDRAPPRRPAPGGERRARFLERLVFEFAAADRAVHAAAWPHDHAGARFARTRPRRLGQRDQRRAAPSASTDSIRRRKASMTRLGPQGRGAGTVIAPPLGRFRSCRRTSSGRLSPAAPGLRPVAGSSPPAVSRRQRARPRVVKRNDTVLFI